jgi:hypothetical protein
METPIPEMPLAERPGPSNREKRVSIFLLGVMAVVAAGIFGVQLRFDPAQWRAQPDETARRDIPGLASEAAAALDASAQVDGLEPMSPPEHFGAETLSDKINGKAELYLPSGFRHLESRRLLLTDDPGLWIERFVYDMGSYANAFSVYSQQRRDSARSLELTPDAYQASNGIFFVQGNHYVEIVGSDASEAVVRKMTALARAFVDKHLAESVGMDERSLLPEKGRVADSITLTASDAFGFEGFDRIYSARYEWEGRTAMAYLSRRASAEEAANLVEEYVQFLLTYGGGPVDPPDGAPPVRIIEILGFVQIVFSQGEFLAGVHEAEDLAQGLALAARLYRNVKEGGHER